MSTNAVPKLVDLNRVLEVANLVVAGFIAWGYWHGSTLGNPYADDGTMLLGLVLCLQTQVALALERRRRDPFVILLVFEMICYYALRVFTLTLFPFSGVFGRYPYDAHDTNFALIFIIIANLFLYAGLRVVPLTGRQSVATRDWRANSPGRVVLLMVVAIAFVYFTSASANTVRVLNFMVLFLAPNLIELLALSYYFLFRKSLSRNFAVAIAALIVTDMVVHTLTGSRSALVTVVENCMLVVLAISGCIAIKRKFVIAGVLAFPVFVLLLLVSFAISTYNRANREFGGNGFDLGASLDLAQQASGHLSEQESLDLVLSPLFARAGFFDFDAELIAHADIYHPLINVPNYGKSIVDNILTPGFDVFDQPLIGQGLQFVYFDLGPPSKLAMTDDFTYQSDQLGMYGELYVLFGYASLPVFFLATFVLKRLYVGIRGSNPFDLTMKRVIVLSVFLQWLRSFGIDWVLLQAVPLMLALFIYAPFFVTRPSSRGPHAVQICAAS